MRAASSSLDARRVHTLRASRGVATLHARVRAPRLSVRQCEVILALILSVPASLRWERAHSAVGDADAEERFGLLGRGWMFCSGQLPSLASISSMPESS